MIETYTNRKPIEEEPEELQTTRRTIGQWVKDYLQEPADGVYSEGKWKTAPIVVALVMAPVVGLNFHILGPMVGLSIACVYAAIYWIGLVFLHYSESRDRWLSLGMSGAELFLMAMMGLNLFTLLIAETQWQAAIQADAIFEKAEGKYLASLAARDSEITGRKDYELQIAREQRETEAIRLATEAEKTKQARWNAAALGEARRLAQTTGKAVGVPSLVRGESPATSPTPEAKKDEAKEQEIPAPPKPKWTAQECLVAWQLWIKIGQGIEFLICVGGLGFLRFRSATNNRRTQEEWKPVGLSAGFLILAQQVLMSVERAGESPSLPLETPQSPKTVTEAAIEADREEKFECGMKSVELPCSISPSVESITEPEFPPEAVSEVRNDLIPKGYNSWPVGNDGWKVWNEIVELQTQNRTSTGAVESANPFEMTSGTDFLSSVESTIVECGIITVGLGNHKLYPKKREGEVIGYDLRRIKVGNGQKKDVCFVNVEKSVPFLTLDPQAQEGQIETWIKEKEQKSSNLVKGAFGKAAGGKR